MPPTRRNIVYISGSQIPSKAANSIHVMRMCDAFVNNGHRVKLISRSPEPGLNDPPRAFYGLENEISITRIASWQGRSLWTFAIAAAAHLLFKTSDFVLSRCPFSALTSCYSGHSTIVELHKLPPQNSRLATSVLPKLFQHQRLLFVICITELLKQDLMKCFPIDEHKVIVLPDGAVEQPILEAGSNSQFTAGYVGNLYPGKGVEVIVPLARKCPEINFEIVGGTGELLNHWKRETGDIANLKWIGHLAPADAVDAARRFDVCLLPNQNRVEACNGRDIGRWTSPLKAFEYMSLGKPILASRLPILKEVLKDNQNCLMCEPDAIDDWAAQLRRLQCDSALRQRLGSTAIDLFKSRFTWRKRAERIVEEYMARVCLRCE